MNTHRHLFHKLLFILAPFIGATALCGCADDDFYTPEVRPGTSDGAHAITFCINSDADTRCEITTSLKTIAEYGIAAVCTFPSTSKASTSDSTLYIDDNIVQITDDGTTWGFYRSDPLWPTGDSTLTFYAYAPADDLAADFTDDTLRLKSSIPTDASLQNDLLLAQTSALNRKTFEGNVGLNFTHICAAVSFRIDPTELNGKSNSNSCTVTSVTLTQVAMTGEYLPGFQTWRPGALSSDVTENMSRLEGTATLSASEISDKESKDFTSSTGQYMMLIPQTFGTDASVVVSYSIGSEHFTKSASLSGLSIEAGKITYISIQPTTEGVTINLNACYSITQLNLNIPSDCTEWSLTSSSSNVTLCTSLTDYQKEGFWIEGDKGNGQLTQQTSKGLIPVYIMAAENVSTSAQDEGTLTLSVTEKDKNTQQTSSYTETYSLTRAAVESGSSSYYIEPEFDTTEYPFGFANTSPWTGTVTFTSDANGVNLKEIANTIRGNVTLTGCTINDHEVVLNYSNCANYYFYYIPYVSDFGSWVGSLDLSPTSSIKYIMSTATAKALFNTYANGVPLIQLLEIEHVLRNLNEVTYTCSDSHYEQYMNCAYLVALKKNNFTLKQGTTSGGVSYQYLDIPNADLTWYLPTNEAVITKTLNNYIWLATTDDNSSNSSVYQFKSTTSKSAVSRTDTYLVRAVRSK